MRRIWGWLSDGSGTLFQYLVERSRCLFLKGFAVALPYAVMGSGHPNARMRVLTKSFTLDALATRVSELMDGAAENHRLRRCTLEDCFVGSCQTTSGQSFLTDDPKQPSLIGNSNQDTWKMPQKSRIGRPQSCLSGEPLLAEPSRSYRQHQRPLPLQTCPPQNTKLVTRTSDAARGSWGVGRRRFLGI